MAEERPERTDACGVLIHVGYHKTGSTWLQQVLFSDSSLAFRLPFERNAVNEEIVAPKQLRFDASGASALFAPGLRPDPACMPVISNERLSGNPHSGGWDSSILADRLAALFPEARILIVIREQQSAIRATYLQYVREGGTESAAQYLAPPDTGRFRRPLFDFDFFAYHALIEYYLQRFGRERVCVLPYELLVADPIDFAARICAFAGIAPPAALPDRRPNVGLSALAAAIKRPLNRCFVRDALNPSPLLPIRNANPRLRRAIESLDAHLPTSLKAHANETLANHIAAATADRYAQSNQRTIELTRLDLGALGYT